MPYDSPFNLPAPRVIVELLADGSLAMEYYANGARQRLSLTRGIELAEIRQSLLDSQRRIATEAQRAAERRASAEAQRSRRVWDNVAYDHGEKFAKEKVGPKPGTRPAPKPSAPAADVGPAFSGFDLDLI